MSIQTGTVTAGTSANVTLSPAIGPFATVAVILTGRATGTVQIKVKTLQGDTFFSLSGVSSIDLTSTDTLIIENASIQAVQIDDTANAGAALTYTIRT